MNDWLHRERMLIGSEAVERLKSATVLIFGVGGVGSYVLEGLLRAGVGNIAVVDNDKVSLTNINRQLIADTTTIGLDKVDIASERAKKINPDCKVTKFNRFATEENIPSIIDSVRPDFVVDAIDTITAKLSIIKETKAREIDVISSMGTGSKLDPTRFRIVDVSKTNTCPLAKVMRIKLREMGINHCDVLFSDEPPIKNSVESELECSTSRHIPGSVSFVPSVAGLIIAGHVIKKLCNLY